MAKQVIVVGGGLSGLSAAHTALENGANVLLLDKSAFMGGNSVRATSGINGAPTRTQAAKGIADSVEAFEMDTHLGGGGVKGEPINPLVTVLAQDSGPAVNWLMDRFNLDLSLVARLGGHSFPRTHRGKEKFPGMTITYALMEKLEEIAAQNSQRARVYTKAKVTKLIQQGNEVVGVEYEKDGKTFQEYGPVVVATGGFAADFSDNSILAQVRPDIMHLPTTNGEHCTGDGIKISTAVGANTKDLSHVQVHPTGLVDPQEPDAKVKFLAAEALRGVGGLLLDRHGNRFCNELGRRDYVTGEMWKNDGPFRLVLNGAAGREIEWHVKHYSSRGLMKPYGTGMDLAKDMGVDPEHLRATFEEYNRVGQSPPDKFGKKYFHNLPVKLEDNFWVAIVTPVIHYCMGGLEVDTNGAVIGPSGPLPGLFAAGEVIGGIHGKNRLGGNSLLDCVVYGRVAGAMASRALFQRVLKQVAAGGAATGAGGALVPQGNGIQASLSNGGNIANVTVVPGERRLSMEISWGDAASAGGSADAAGQSTASSAPASGSSSASSGSQSTSTNGHPNPTDKPSPKRTITWDEVKQHTTEDDCWVVVRGEVLDATNFLKDHPGGKKAILMWAGKDATAEFDMFHKPDVVAKYAPGIVLGDIEGASPSAAPSGAAPAASSESSGAHPSAESPSGPKRKISWDEVKKHNTEGDIWVVVKGEVLDVTNFLKDHPGGKKAILMYGGKDATEEFEMFHKAGTVEKYAPWAVIGDIVEKSNL